MTVNRLAKQVAAFVVGASTFIIVVGLAGNVERTEQIIYSMPQEAYETIYLKLGPGCTDQAIVDEYMSNRAFYDSLKS